METGSSARKILELHQEGARHHNALPLPAAQLVRVAPQRILWLETGQAQTLLDQLLDRLARGSQPKLAHGW